MRAMVKARPRYWRKSPRCCPRCNRAWRARRYNKRCPPGLRATRLTALCGIWPHTSSRAASGSLAAWPHQRMWWPRRPSALIPPRRWPAARWRCGSMVQHFWRLSWMIIILPNGWWRFAPPCRTQPWLWMPMNPGTPKVWRRAVSCWRTSMWRCWNSPCQRVRMRRWRTLSIHYRSAPMRAVTPAKVWRHCEVVMRWSTSSWIKRAGWPRRWRWPMRLSSRGLR